MVSSQVRFANFRKNPMEMYISIGLNIIGIDNFYKGIVDSSSRIADCECNLNKPISSYNNGDTPGLLLIN